MMFEEYFWSVLIIGAVSIFYEGIKQFRIKEKQRYRNNRYCLYCKVFLKQEREIISSKTGLPDKTIHRMVMENGKYQMYESFVCHECGTIYQVLI